MQPLLGSLELEDVTEEAEGLVVGDVPDRDLDQLEDVLEHVNALDHHDGHEEPEQPRFKDSAWL